MTKTPKKRLILAILMGLIFILILGIGCVSAWWDTSYLKKQSITELDGEIMLINVTYDSDMQADFDDVRFVNSTEDGEIGYFLQDKIDSSWATFRVNNSEGSIWMYYENASVSTTSNITNVYGSDLRGAYFFDNATAWDSSPNAFNGILNGTSLVNDGKLGSAYNFRGIGFRDYVNISSEFGLNTGWMVSMWVNFSNLNQGGCFFDVGSGATNKGVCVGIGSDTVDGNGGRLVGLNNGVGNIATSVNFTYGFSHVVLIIHPNKTTEFWLNDSSVFVWRANNATLPYDAVALIGDNAYPDTDRSFDGLIDELLIINNTDVSLISRLYNSSDSEGVFGAERDSVTAPNLTIIQPSGSKNSLTINYNVTSSDWDISTCIYWVTLSTGALHISNQTVTCSSEITGTFNVASDNTNYIFNFFVNDTSGNTNQSNSSFSTTSGAVVLAGGGGGGSIPTAKITAGTFIRGAVCQPFKDAWVTAWEESKTREFTDSLEKFSYLWSKFWNYALCSGSASTIVPL